MIFLVAGCFCVLAGIIAWQAYAADKERTQFASERREWVKERHELNSRIQAPEAASFMFEGDETDAEDDMPVLPDFTMTEDELEQAKRELEAAGYAEGPVA